MATATQHNEAKGDPQLEEAPRGVGLMPAPNEEAL